MTEFLQAQVAYSLSLLENFGFRFSSILFYTNTYIVLISEYYAATTDKYVYRVL